jgi:hypothetical protein
MTGEQGGTPQRSGLLTEDDYSINANVTIRCRGCGREIWQEAPDYLTLREMRVAECADCIQARAIAALP